MAIIHQYKNKSGEGFTRWHLDPHKPGHLTVESVFDRSIAIESAARIRNEVNQRGQELVHAMRVPDALFFHWLKSGQLSMDDVQGNPEGVVVDKKKLQALMKEYPALSCVDKL